MKYRPCFQCAIAALAAVGLCVFLHNEIAWILTAAGITLAAVFIWITGKKYRLNTVLCLLTALGCMGSFAHSYFSVYESALAQVGPVRDVVAQVEAPMSDSYKGNPRWAMRILSLNHESLKRPAVMLVEVELPDIDLHIGSTVRFYTDIRQSNRYATKDTTVRDLSYGIFLEGTMDASSMPQLLSDAKPSFAINMARQKQRLCTAADERLSSKAAQVFKGMLYGDKYNLEEDILLEFRYSGFAHLLAVSGLHIQVIFALIAALLSFPLRFCRRRNEIARMVSLAFVWGFILLIGCPVSAVRSGIMVFVSTVGVLVAKRSDTLNSLGVSVAAILLLMPFSICSLGFWMSVLATFGIGSAGMYFSRRWKSFTNQKLEQNRVRLQDWAREGVKLHPEHGSHPAGYA